MTARKKSQDLIALAEMREIFDKIASEEYGFFIARTGTTRGNTSSKFRLYYVKDNTPYDMTGVVARACGCRRNKNGDISIGGYGHDRCHALMYYYVGFALFSDNGVTPPAALSSTALVFANKYYRNTI